MHIKTEVVKEALSVIGELYDFIDGLAVITDNDREEWVGEDSDGLQGRAEEAMRGLEKSLPKRGKQNSNQARKQ